MAQYLEPGVGTGLTPTSPVALSVDVLALDAPVMHCCASPSPKECLAPFTLCFMACLSPTKSVASQRQVLSLPCSLLFIQ